MTDDSLSQRPTASVTKGQGIDEGHRPDHEHALNQVGLAEVQTDLGNRAFENLASQTLPSLPSLATIPNPVFLNPPLSSPLKSTATSRYLLNSVSAESSSQANLAITLGRATGAAMALCNHRFNSSSGQLQGVNLTNLNPSALEFKPSFSSVDLRIKPAGSASGQGSVEPSHCPVEVQNFDLISRIDGVVTRFNSQSVSSNPGSLLEPSYSSIAIATTPETAQLTHFSTCSVTNDHQDSPSYELMKPDDLLRFEQPGKDNMRTFKFPSQRYFIQNHRLQSGPSQVLSDSKLNTAPLGVISSSASSSGSSNLNDGDRAFEDRPLMSLALPMASIITPTTPSPQSSSSSSMSISDDNTRELVSALKQRSSFDDDSSVDDKDEYQDAEEEEEGGNSALNPQFSYQLISTQPRSEAGSSLADDQSIVSLRQLQEQKREWAFSDISHPVETYDADEEEEANRGEGNNVSAQAGIANVESSLSIPVLLSSNPLSNMNRAGVIAAGPPMIIVPPGSPFSPFESKFTGDNHDLSRNESGDEIIHPLSLSHSNARAFGLPHQSEKNHTPLKSSSAAKFRPINSTCIPASANGDYVRLDDLDGAPQISIRNYQYDFSSPKAPSGLGEPVQLKNSTGMMGDQSGSLTEAEAQLDSCEIEEEPLFSSKRLDDDDDDPDERSGLTDSSSSSSASPVMKDEQGPPTTKVELERILTKKLGQLRNDLSGLHSLKVDLDSLKRDALLDEINGRMESVLENWMVRTSRPTDGANPKEYEDFLVGRVGDRCSKEIEAKFNDQIGKLSSSFLVRPKFVVTDGESEGGRDNADNGEKARSLEATLDLEEVIRKLSDAVKPQIYQLIDLASDKAETAGLIFQHLKPCFEQLNQDLRSHLKLLESKLFLDPTGGPGSRLEESEVGTDEENGQGNQLLPNAQCRSSLAWPDWFWDRFKVIDGERIENLVQSVVEANNVIKPPENTVESFKELLHGSFADLKGDLARLQGDLKHDLNQLTLEISDHVKIPELLQRNRQLEIELNQIRNEYGNLRAERAIEKESLIEDKNQYLHEKVELERLNRDLNHQLSEGLKNQELLKQDLINLDKQRIELNLNYLGLQSRLDKLNEQEKESERVKMSQIETIKSLEANLELIESDHRRSIDMMNRFKELEVLTFKEQEQKLRLEIEQIRSDFQHLDQMRSDEIKDLLESRTKLEDEVKGLEKRLSSSGDRIVNLQSSLAAKQQVLAKLTQKSSESEKKVEEFQQKIEPRLVETIREGEGRRLRLEEELNRNQRERGEEKARFEQEMAEHMARFEEAMNSNEGLVRHLQAERNAFEGEVSVLKGETKNLRAELSKLRAGAETFPRIAASGANFNSSPAQYVTSQIPLTSSIHAVPRLPTNSTNCLGRQAVTEHRLSGLASCRSGSSRSSSKGTVKSYDRSIDVSGYGPRGRSTSGRRMQMNGDNGIVLVDAEEAQDRMRHRSEVSPTPSRMSHVSRITMDQEGWWSAD